MQCMRPTDVSTCLPKYKLTLGATFDDGPSEWTDELLDFLKSQNVTATLFVLGSHVIKYPLLLQRAYNEGHTIAAHTWSHYPMANLTNEQFISEIMWTELAIEKAIGIRPRFWRPPFGDIDDRIRAILKQLDYTPVIWSLSPQDATHPYIDVAADKKTVLDYLVNELGFLKGMYTKLGNPDPNYIILEHDRVQATVELAPQVYSILAAWNYTIKDALGAGCTDYSTSDTYAAPRATKVLQGSAGSRRRRDYGEL
ncbi:chitin deacetylase [Geranomyces variabilis]|uniref:Chitin deacetylase n=1 Tax=Geranomyces variabilis TaxID=109894 RepID=A0AAD5TE39_9FUNG|nr:chitin deacetylase [Geranomyces variabilis]